MKIKVLPDQVVNQIAAGEVVERPSSVVRELVENSIDAGADEISVYLERGGHSLIRIIDNGCGMERDDALLALERHATSKISDASDLLSIGTLGFRGEALPSIAAVSKIVMRTRVASKDVGTELLVQGGAIKDVRPGAFPVGTDFEVRALFYNTPVRRKFLKSERSEELKVKSWLTASALSRPGVRYRLYFDGREVLNLPKRASVLERGSTIFKSQAISLSQSVDERGYGICGMVSHPSVAQADAGAFILLVNGRVVSDKILLRAVREGFSSTLKDREFPVGFLSLTIPGSRVDVNVHPQKSEVRFLDSQEIFAWVRDSVRSATVEFRAPSFYSAPPVARYQPVSAPRIQGHVEVISSPRTTQYANHQEDLHLTSVTAEPKPLFGTTLTTVSIDTLQEDRPLEQSFRYSKLRYLGQALQCYLFCELDDRVYVVDMHAAHERYNYNLVRNNFRAKTMMGQELLLPITVEVGEAGVESFKQNEEMLSAFGFGIEIFGESSVIIRCAPTVLKSSDVTTLLKEVLGVSFEDDASGKLDEKIDHIAARIACHASIRSGEDLQKEEVYALFEALDRTEFSAACPHGRPVIVSFSEGDIERWFGRDR